MVLYHGLVPLDSLCRGLGSGIPTKAPSPSPHAHDVRLNVWRTLVETEEEIESMDVKQEITDESLGEHNPDYEIAALCIRDLLEDEMLKFTPPAITECKIFMTSKEMIEILEVVEHIQESLLRGTGIALQKRQAKNRN